MRSLAAWCVLVAGCGGHGSDGCPGARPSIADCYSGLFFAECGGDDTQRFACRTDDSTCKWFQGCVAAGYVASNCPSQDLCCIYQWPFKDEFDEGVLFSALHGYGTAAWDRSRAMRITVAFDPAISAGDLVVTCSGSIPTEESPCAGPEPYSVRLLDTLIVGIGHVDLQPGWVLWAEVDLEATPVAMGRVCKAPATDLQVRMCRSGTDVECAESGSVRLNRAPSSPADLPGLVVMIDVLFADGLRFEASFVR